MSEELFGMEGVPEGTPSPALPAAGASGSEAAFGAGASPDWESFVGGAALPRGVPPKTKSRRLTLPELLPPAEITPPRRLLILDTWRRSGLTAGDFAVLVGVSKHTLYAWKKRFEEEGPGGLVDRPRGSVKGSKLPDLTKRAILMMKEANPDWGSQRISDMLVRGPALPASPSAVLRVTVERQKCSRHRRACASGIGRLRPSARREVVDRHCLDHFGGEYGVSVSRNIPKMVAIYATSNRITIATQTNGRSMPYSDQHHRKSFIFLSYSHREKFESLAIRKALKAHAPDLMVFGADELSPDDHIEKIKSAAYLVVFVSQLGLGPSNKSHTEIEFNEAVAASSGDSIGGIKYAIKALKGRSLPDDLKSDDQVSQILKAYVRSLHATIAELSSEQRKNIAQRLRQLHRDLVDRQISIESTSWPEIYSEAIREQVHSFTQTLLRWRVRSGAQPVRTVSDFHRSSQSAFLRSVTKSVLPHWLLRTLGSLLCEAGITKYRLACCGMT